ncbi:MAG: hypothetical protein HUJ63_09205 [Enterococcus sp.]|nr:hypothetical protein [Enterococcus sp.]
MGFLTSTISLFNSVEIPVWSIILLIVAIVLAIIIPIIKGYKDEMKKK